jgi:hypothetical protein
MRRWPPINPAEPEADDGDLLQAGAGVVAGAGAIAAMFTQRSTLPLAGAAIAMAMAGSVMAATAVLGAGLGKGMESVGKEMGDRWRLRKQFEAMAKGEGLAEDIVVRAPLRFKPRTASFTMILSPQMQGAW